MNKRYISAGAGSGKTYTVTTEVARLVKEHKLNPEQVIMTTFTKAAAQELREKAKKQLVEIGLYQEAQQMEHALIGTVHSVANTLLSKYWYLLGITPDASPMEEEELTMYRDHSLRGLLSQDERKFMYGYCERNNVVDSKSGKHDYEFWKRDLCSVLDYIQWYSIGNEQLDKSIETSESFIKCLEPKKNLDLQNTAQNLISEIYAALAEGRSSAKKKEEQQHISSMMGKKLNDTELEELLALAESRCKESQTASELRLALLFSKQSIDDHKEYVRIIFRLAKEWRKMYRNYKDENHLIDFNDMEEMFLWLLDNEEVRQDICSRYTHLYVDEFQDSNPMQVRIFQKLSELLDTCYVGDKKQAIYGFRGSDTKLTTAVADSIGNRETLKHSYRSVEPLVRFSNAVFTKAFKEIPAKEVELSMPEKNGNNSHIEAPLRLWPWAKKADLAKMIQQFILKELQKPKEDRIQPKEIAVLARKNDDLDDLAVELGKLNVPVCREFNKIKDSRSGKLIKALLTLIAAPSNQQARAEVVFLTEQGRTLTDIIENRLDNMREEEGQHTYLLDSPILSRLWKLMHFGKTEDQKNKHNLLAYQSISALVETLIIELDLYSVVQGWENTSAEENNLAVFVELAQKYEDSSNKLAMPATVTGFISYFCDQDKKGAANDEGVRLFTFHKSKGLEWKVVILLSLDKDTAIPSDVAMRNMLGCHNHREEDPTPENTNPPMTISIVRNIYGKRQSSIDAVTSRLQEHRLWETIRNQEIEESKRLLYVAVTRARNILVLAAKTDASGNTVNLNWFKSIGLEGITSTIPSGEGNIDLFNLGSCFRVERLPLQGQSLEWSEESGRKTHDIFREYSYLDNNYKLVPSQAGRTPHDIRPINRMEHRLTVSNKKEEEAKMGDFIHHVFCCMDDGISLEQIIELRNSYGFSEKNMPEPEKLYDSWDFLTYTLTKEFGPSLSRHHEMPFRFNDSLGRLATGFIDLIWETEDGYVIVDYKTCPGNYNLVFSPESEHFAGRHGDQLNCYQEYLEKTSEKPILSKIIYYPVTQFITEIK